MKRHATLNGSLDDTPGRERKGKRYTLKELEAMEREGTLDRRARRALAKLRGKK